MADTTPITSEDLGKGAIGAIKSTVDFFSSLSQQIDSILIDSVANTYKSVAKATYPITMGFLVLWVCVFGIMLMLKPGQVSIRNFMWRFGKAIAICALAFSWGNVYEYIVNPVLNGSQEFIANAAGADAEKLLLENVARIFQHVSDTVSGFSTGMDVGAALIVALIAMLNFLFAAAQIASYFFFVIEAKIILAILLIVAPIFLSFLMFESTRNFFTNWVSAIMHPILTLLLMALVMSFMGYVTKQALNQVMGGDVIGVNISSAFLAVIISLFTVAFIWKAPRLASNLVSNGFGLNDGNGRFAPLQRLKAWNNGRMDRQMKKQNYRDIQARKKGN